MIRIRGKVVRGFLSLPALCLLLSAGCKKSPSSATTQTPTASVQLTMPAQHLETEGKRDAAAQANAEAGLNEFIAEKYASDPAKAKAMQEFAAQADAEGDAEEKLAQFHRLTMVAPAPADFKAEPVDRKIRLHLVLERATLRAGELPRYRLEMTNVGRKPIDYSETKASFFVKDASVLDSSCMRFYLTDPQGHRSKLLPKRPPETFQATRLHGHDTEYLPDSMSTADKEKWLKETNAMASAHSTFRVKLMPGETLHSIGDDDSPKENFRTLFVRAHFDHPGIYQLQVEMDDRPEPVTAQEIEDARTYATSETLNKWHEERVRKALGPVSSNVGTIEVLP